MAATFLKFEEMTTTQRIQRAHAYLMNDNRYALYSGLFLLGAVSVIDDAAMTARTNGFDVEYGEGFVRSLAEPEIRALVLHENMHKGFRHLAVWKHLYTKNAHAANMACDYVINLMIYDSDPDGKAVRLPKGGCLDERFRGMDAAQVFKILTEESEESDGGSGAAPAQGSLDEHDWENAKELSEEQEASIEEAIRQGLVREKMIGGADGAGFRELAASLNTSVPWEKVLAEFVSSVTTGKDTSTWKRPARKWVYEGVYMPSSESERIGPIVVALDTSGSISDGELGAFLAELGYICRVTEPERVDLLYWGSRVVGHEKYGDGAGMLPLDALVQSTKPGDGGGTELFSVVKYVNEKMGGVKPSAVVVFTDGYVGEFYDDGKFGCPVLYCVTSGVIPSAGRHVRIEL